LSRKKQQFYDDAFWGIAERYEMAVLREHANWQQCQQIGNPCEKEMCLMEFGQWIANKAGISRIEHRCREVREEFHQERSHREALREKEKLAEPHKFRKPLKQKQRTKIFERDGYKCVWCGSQKNLQVDHIEPLLKGGTDEDANLRTLCGSCNIKKGGKYDHELTAQPSTKVIQ
jgi:5-methylcytosine-specific restriction endonuclease McrA